MSHDPHISICIPAYKRVEFLQRLFESIQRQEFRDYEIVVTDDSPDDQVRSFCEAQQQFANLRYHRNETTLGTPENWNRAIALAKGEWIKLMHDDDWFASENSLGSFAAAIGKHPGKEMFFSAYTNVYASTQKEETVQLPAFRFRQLQRNPVTLFSRNIIGPPSVLLHRNRPGLRYDNTLKWLVDIDFYIQQFRENPPVYIPEPLIKVGLGSHQVTADCVRQRPVEIPENFYLINKVGHQHLRHPMVYDAFWRLLRNLEITRLDEIRQAGYKGEINPAVQSMVHWQNKLPSGLLKQGLFSKTLMLLHYLIYSRKI